ncbi:hypothetical protein JCM10908_007075 [Rhodotorula pacifica]|uniref:uncharacterized protein n=1 Tax=Rhodotorula pacifica TaxID=1495444 RepID=UPI00317D7564
MELSTRTAGRRGRKWWWSRKEDQLRPLKEDHRRRRSCPGGIISRRRTIIAALAILAFLLFSLSSSPKVAPYALDEEPPEGTDDALTPAAASSGCSSPALFEERNQASFWTIERRTGAGPPELVIRPLEQETYHNCPALADAMFSVWVDYGDEVQYVSTPPRQHPMGVYSISDFPPPIKDRSQSSVTAELVVRLDYGFYPGGDLGQPCSADECMPESMAHAGFELSGEEIQDTYNERVRLQLRFPRLVPSATPLRYCAALDPLPAAYSPSDKSFSFRAAAGGPCALRNVGDRLPAQPRLRWIQVLGDSSSRYLVVEMAKMLGLDEIVTHVESTRSHLPMTVVCHDGTGTGIVLVFHSVFLEQPSSAVQSLDAVHLASLTAFLHAIPFPDDTRWPVTFDDPSLRPTDLFMLFGSYAQRLSKSGFVAAINRLHPGLARLSRLARRMYFMLTPPAESREVPERYAGDEIMSNNRIIEMQNEVARNFFDTNLPETVIIDTYTMTRTLPMALPLDSAHYKPDVYRVQAALMWTAMHASDTRIVQA